MTPLTITCPHCQKPIDLSSALTKKLKSSIRAEQLESLREKATTEIAHEFELKDRDKNQLIEGLRKQINDLQRRVEQGSQQAQGETLEVALEEQLKRTFPSDNISEVPKGVNGADILQHVMLPNGSHCGTIVWECKRTKVFQQKWISKLLDDQRESKADIAVLVSEVLLDGVNSFGMIDGVWVCSYSVAIELATALRLNLIQVCEILSVNKNETGVSALFDYLTGQEFRQRVESVARIFMTMQTDLEKERRTIKRIWIEREIQIKRLTEIVTDTHRDILTIARDGSLGGLTEVFHAQLNEEAE